MDVGLQILGALAFGLGLDWLLHRREQPELNKISLGISAAAFVLFLAFLA